jgi:hypothetical protein
VAPKRRERMQALTKHTMRGRTVGLAMAIAGVVLAGFAGPATAQIETATAVSGTIDECLTVAIGSDTTGPGASAMTTDQVWKCQGTSSDPRLSGEIDLVYNIMGWSGTGAVQWGFARISNDDGSWNGTWSSNVQEGGDQVILGWYTGDGAYEGWSYVETQVGEFQQSRETFGIVYPGPPPPTVVITPLPTPAAE